MFVDHIRIYAKAGDGGNGSMHFRRDKFEPKGGPDGGDGGRGGDIIFEVSPNTDNLKAFFFKTKIKAQHGDCGHGQQKTGKSGKHSVFLVPPGTLVYRCPKSKSDDDAYFDDEEDEVQDGAESENQVAQLADDSSEDESADYDPEKGELIADLCEVGQRFVVCQGGKGGKGNVHFKSSTNRAPEQFQEGGEGEDGYFFLELQKIADAGLVGFPNAGKSTLLGALSAAKPKVASYPFTTLQPSVGVLEFPGFARGTVADIPGLIEGAHRNVGLGHDFLRHIMRCQILLFVVDMAGTDGRDAISDLQILRKEIKLHDESLATYPWIIIANKMDVEGTDEQLVYLKNRFPNQEIIPISAQDGGGLDTLRGRLEELIAKRPE